MKDEWELTTTHLSYLVNLFGMLFYILFVAQKADRLHARRMWSFLAMLSTSRHCT